MALTDEQRACTHHSEKSAWTGDWHCRHCGAQWGETLIAYFRDKAAASEHAELNGRTADILEARTALCGQLTESENDEQ